MKRALITGINGMDGSYLADLLLEKEYEVFDSSKFVEGVAIFEKRMNDYIDSKFSSKSTTQVINEMSVKLNATFQNVV